MFFTRKNAVFMRLLAFRKRLFTTRSKRRKNYAKIYYRRKNRYPIPCLTVEESSPLSKYGRLRKRYLREHKRVLYYTLLTSGKLYEHLAEIDTSARDRAEYLIKEMARKQGVTEELKARDMLRWVGKMNNIRACADEIVLNDIVYS